MTVENIKAGFWQVQDKVDQSTIQKFTNSCERDDCCVSARIVSEQTCMATSDCYDKQGRLVISDHNRYKVSMCCSKCWRHEIMDNCDKK